MTRFDKCLVVFMCMFVAFIFFTLSVRIKVNSIERDACILAGGIPVTIEGAKMGIEGTDIVCFSRQAVLR